MDNFIYSVPTKIYFGKDMIRNLVKIKELGQSVLVVYGKKSIKKTGIYDQVMEYLNNAEMNIYTLGGVEPNPRIETVREGVKICRDNEVDVVLAVGGGSSIDCAKVIAAGALYDGDAWDLVENGNKIKKALPLVSVLTMAATGSEMDGFAVISDMETNRKLGTGSPVLKPGFSILDPEYTFSVPRKHTIAGVADIMSHVFENYFTPVKDAYLQARMAEAVLKTCINYAPLLLEDPSNYSARANIMWASSIAINGLLSCGADVSWSVHAMEHELSAYYDITHGEGLAILTPYWMDRVLNKETAWKFKDYGINVWNLDPSMDSIEIGKKSIAKTRTFFQSLGLPRNLSDVGIGDENICEMAKNIQDRYEDTFVKLSYEDLVAIYQAAL